jgi:predicted nucleotidyltransferase
MNVAGIIAEYNPLHGGHVHHIARTKQLLGPEACVVAVMSGHAVQRGDVPVLTKYARAEMAALAGADLVFELPAASALAGAERFARAGVSILRRLGIVTHLSFGAECADIGILRAAAARVPETYPKDMSLAHAYPAFAPEFARLFTPNNILAIEYLRALEAQNCPLEPIAMLRVGGGHDSGGVYSASEVRRRLFGGEAADASMPGYALSVYKREAALGRAPIRADGMAVLSYLRRLSPEDFEALPEMGGGLHRRLYQAARNAGSWEELIARAKTRRFPASRLRRAFFCAFFGITEADAQKEPPVRLLAIGGRGGELLRHVRATIISRAAAHKNTLVGESCITDQLALWMPKPHPAGMEWTTKMTKSSTH